MKQIGTCKIHFLSKAMSPITHNMGTSGNESILNRSKSFHNGKVVDIPVLSGNALRHKMIREPGALYLVNRCDLRGKLSIDQANYIFTGGSLTESSTNDNIPLIAEIQEISPLFRLLGGSLKNQVVGGSLFVSQGLLVCEENKQTIEKMCSPYELPEEHFLTAQNFISKYQYTRGDAGRMKDSGEIIKDPEKQQTSNLMIYSGESIIQGSMFYHNLTLYNVSPIEVGAALHCVQLWQAADGIIGGSARIGHGKLKSEIWIDGLIDWFGDKKQPGELVKDYITHVGNHAEDFRGWLKKAFPTKESLL